MAVAREQQQREAEAEDDGQAAEARGALQVNPAPPVGMIDRADGLGRPLDDYRDDVGRDGAEDEEDRECDRGFEHCDPRTGYQC